MPYLLYFVNSTSLVSKSVIRRYSRANFRGQDQLRSIIVLLWPEVKFSIWPFEVKIIHVSMRLGERNTMVNPHNESAVFLSSKVIFEKRYISKSLSFYFDLTWRGHYDLKRSTRVPLDSERHKDSFGFRPTAPSQLGAKWLGVGGNPLPHVRSRMGKLWARVNAR